MISPSNRALAIELIQEANQNGARLAKACQELHISVRTYERWISDGGVKVDQRPLTKRPTPKNKLSQEEREEILTVVKQEEYADFHRHKSYRSLRTKELTLRQNQHFIVYCVKKRCNITGGVAKSLREESLKVIWQQRQIKCGHGILLGSEGR